MTGVDCAGLRHSGAWVFVLGLGRCCSSYPDEAPALEETYKVFSTALLNHVVREAPVPVPAPADQNPVPGPVGVLSPDEAKTIAEYFAFTFFAHYNLYVRVCRPSGSVVKTEKKVRMMNPPIN